MKSEQSKCAYSSSYWSTMVSIVVCRTVILAGYWLHRMWSARNNWPGAMSLLPTRSRAAGGFDVDLRGSASSDKQDCVAMLPSSSAAGQGCQQPNHAQAVFVFGHGPRVHAAHTCVATLPVRPAMDTPTACADGEAPGGASSQGTHSSQARKSTAVGVQCQRV